MSSLFPRHGKRQQVIYTYVYQTKSHVKTALYITMYNIHCAVNE